MKSAQWRKLSKRLKHLSNNCCVCCGLSSKLLDVHHLTYERFGKERISDLQVLCRTCHEAADKERVKQREARGEAARYEAALDTYMTKRYGEDYMSDMTVEDVEQFDEWLRRKEEDEDLFTY